MKIDPFKMERMQSIWENLVSYNLSESGVHPLSLQEFTTQEELEEIVKMGLGYCQTNGTPELREKISKLYPQSNIDQILVTNGSAEANFILMWSILEPEDEVVFMIPNYMQMWGLIRCFGAVLKPFYLRENLNWVPDLDELKKLITRKTKLIIITNPNNPTGSVLSSEAMETITSLAEKVGAWILSDEVYQGAELSGHQTQSFYEKYEKTIVVNGLSKAYGLPGLRIGWIVAPEDFIKKTWLYHDYTTIAPGMLSDRLAQIALSPGRRDKILKRTNRILNKNFSILQSWLNKHEGTFSFTPPRAGAIVFVRYNLKMNSSQLAQRLIHEKSVLIVPGDHFEMDHFLRFGYGGEEKKLLKALDLIGEATQEIKSKQIRVD